MRLRFFVHVSRLHEDAPAKLALKEALRYTKKPIGRPVTTLLGTLKSQLKELNIDNFDDALTLRNIVICGGGLSLSMSHRRDSTY